MTRHFWQWHILLICFHSVFQNGSGTNQLSFLCGRHLLMLRLTWRLTQKLVVNSGIQLLIFLLTLNGLLMINTSLHSLSWLITHGMGVPWFWMLRPRMCRRRPQNSPRRRNQSLSWWSLAVSRSLKWFLRCRSRKRPRQQSCPMEECLSVCRLEKQSRQVQWFLRTRKCLFLHDCWSVDEPTRIYARGWKRSLVRVVHVVKVAAVKCFWHVGRTLQVSFHAVLCFVQWCVKWRFKI